MSRKGLITKEDYKGLLASYGITRSEKGTLAILNENLAQTTRSLTKQSMYQADHEGHSGLSGKHARTAIEFTPEVPDGIY